MNQGKDDGVEEELQIIDLGYPDSMLPYIQRWQKIQNIYQRNKNWLKRGFIFLLVPVCLITLLSLPPIHNFWWSKLSGIPLDAITVHTHNDEVDAVRQIDGTPLWHTMLDSPPAAGPQVFNHTIYIFSKNGTYYALKEDDGSLLWQYSDSANINPPIMYDGIIYSYNISQEYLKAVRADNGQLLWKTSIDGHVVNQMIVQDNSIYVTSDEKYISMIERKNGAIGWHISLSERLTSHLAVTDAAVYYSTNQNHLFAINASSGTVLWQKTLPGLSSGPLDLNQLYVSGNILIYLDDNSTLHTANLQALALRTDTGSILWRNNLDGWAVNSATLYHNSIDILTENGTVAAYDIQSGKRQWQVTFNGNYPSYISLDKDTLIARSANGTSFILDAQNGSILHQYQIPMATYSAIIENGKAYVNPGKDPQNAGIVSYDVNNGMVLWRYHLIVPLSSPTFSDQKILVNDFLGNTYILSAANGSLLKILQNT